MLKLYNFVLKLKSDKLFPFSVVVKKCSEVVVNKTVTDKLCSVCKMYNKRGSCPPFAPEFSVLSKNYNQWYLIVFYIYPHLYCTEKQIKSPFLVISAVEKTWKTSKLEQLVFEQFKTMKCLTLTTSWCFGCGTKTCELASRGKCVNSVLRTFSLEATGVLVNETLKVAKLRELEWVEFSPPRVPEVLQKVVMVLCNDLPQQTIETHLLSILEQREGVFRV